MDPLTLFALANGAVKLVKEGCKLYKDIKDAAGEVGDVLKDLDDQFHKKFKNREPTVAEKNQYIQEKNRIIELNKSRATQLISTQKLELTLEHTLITFINVWRFSKKRNVAVKMKYI